MPSADDDSKLTSDEFAAFWLEDVLPDLWERELEAEKKLAQEEKKNKALAKRLHNVDSVAAAIQAMVTVTAIPPRTLDMATVITSV